MPCVVPSCHRKEAWDINSAVCSLKPPAALGSERASPFPLLCLSEDSADWEKELQQELQEYEVVTESEKRDENWDKEIEKMLQEEN